MALTRGWTAGLPHALAFAGVAAYPLSVALLRDGAGASGGFGALVRRVRGRLRPHGVPLLAVGGVAYPVSGCCGGALITVIAASVGSGVAEWDAAVGADGLTGAADDALYAAKRAGRVRIELCELSELRAS